MEVIKLVLFVILEICLVHSARIPRKDEASFRKHATRVAAFTCSVPRPRALRSMDFIDKNKLPGGINSHVLPPMTVLHRCDAQSGCCDQGKACTVNSSETVTLTFKIVTITANYKIVPPTYETVKVSNHTKCECAGLNDKPK